MRRAPSQITLSGQVETMRESFSGLFSGMAIAVVLVFLLLVINFQSVTNSVIVLAGGSLRALRRDVDALLDANPYQRAGADGNAHVHRFDHRE